MTTLLRFIVLLSIIGVVCPLHGAADQVILNSGETFSSQQIWEENDKIRFNMQGLIVSVKKEDVRAIVRGKNNATGTDVARLPAVVVVPEAPAQSEPKLSQAVKAPTDRKPVIPKSPAPSPKNPSLPETRSIKGTGLQGLVWKASPSSLPGLVMIDTDPAYGGVDQYHRPQDDLQMGKARLDGKVYGFWKNQLYTVMFWVEGRPGYQRLKETVRVHYGGGRQSTSGAERYVWKDRDTDRMLEFDAPLNTGIFWMRSRNLDKQIKRLSPE